MNIPLKYFFGHRIFKNNLIIGETCVESWNCPCTTVYTIWDKSVLLLGTSWGTHWELDGNPWGNSMETQFRVFYGLGLRWTIRPTTGTIVSKDGVEDVMWRVVRHIWKTEISRVVTTLYRLVVEQRQIVFVLRREWKISNLALRVQSSGFRV
jgi:hypothetical protein